MARFSRFFSAPQPEDIFPLGDRAVEFEAWLFGHGFCQIAASPLEDFSAVELAEQFLQDARNQGRHFTLADADEVVMHGAFLGGVLFAEHSFA